MGGDTISFEGKVAIVTGAGNGLGRAYALSLAARGARVLVNDLGGTLTGQGASHNAADQVVHEITEAGGEAVANYHSVEEGDAIVSQAVSEFGRVDVLINNAGILRDVSFHKMTDNDWDAVYRVHLLGAYKTTHAAWPLFREQGYGRVVFTSSSAGLYGNFGQVNYGAMKLALYGMAQALALEGAAHNIRVNTIAPVAGSRMTDTVMDANAVASLSPDCISPLVAFLCSEQCQASGKLFELGGGWVSQLRWQRSQGSHFKPEDPLVPEDIQAGWDTITDFTNASLPEKVADSISEIENNINQKVTFNA